MFFRNHITPNSYRQAPHRDGFTLVEMAIVLLIVTLLLTGLVPTISSQIEQRQRNETRKQLDDIRDALLGFVVSKAGCLVRLLQLQTVLKALQVEFALLPMALCLQQLLASRQRTTKAMLWTVGRIAYVMLSQ